MMIIKNWQLITRFLVPVLLLSHGVYPQFISILSINTVLINSFYIPFPALYHQLRHQSIHISSIYIKWCVTPCVTTYFWLVSKFSLCFWISPISKLFHYFSKIFHDFFKNISWFFFKNISWFFKNILKIFNFSKIFHYFSKIFHFCSKIFHDFSIENRKIFNDIFFSRDSDLTTTNVSPFVSPSVDKL